MRERIDPIMRRFSWVYFLSILIDAATDHGGDWARPDLLIDLLHLIPVGS